MPMSKAERQRDETEARQIVEHLTKRARGAGSIFTNGSPMLWIAFSERGIRHRENTHSTDRSVAEKLLKRRLAEVETKTFVQTSSVRVDELADDLMHEYREKKRKTLSSLEQRWRIHLKPWFTKRRACDVTTVTIRTYIKKRTEQGAANATINRELSVLKRAFHAATESTPPKVRSVPFIPMLKEDNVRTGFLRDEQYRTLAAECAKSGLWLRAILAVGCNFGWRLSEVKSLRVRSVDFMDRTIRLEPGTTKNGKGRTVKMTQEVSTLLTACASGKQPDDALFTREDGSPVADFRGAWQGACVRSGLAQRLCTACNRPMTTTKCSCGSRNRRYVGLKFHDLRRTAARNLRRLGVSESVAMKITGHLTSSIFRRYDIIEAADLADAAARLDAKAAAQTRVVQDVEHPPTITALLSTVN
jgi:integrase